MLQYIFAIDIFSLSVLIHNVYGINGEKTLGCFKSVEKEKTTDQYTPHSLMIQLLHANISTPHFRVVFCVKIFDQLWTSTSELGST